MHSQFAPVHRLPAAATQTSGRNGLAILSDKVSTAAWKAIRRCLVMPAILEGLLGPLATLYRLLYVRLMLCTPFLSLPGCDRGEWPYLKRHFAVVMKVTLEI